MAAPFFRPVDDGHNVFSLPFTRSFDGALCSFVGEVLVVVDNGIHHSRATWLKKLSSPWWSPSRGRAGDKIYTRTLGTARSENSA